MLTKHVNTRSRAQTVERLSLCRCAQFPLSGTERFSKWKLPFSLRNESANTPRWITPKQLLVRQTNAAFRCIIHNYHNRGARRGKPRLAFPLRALNCAVLRLTAKMMLKIMRTYLQRSPHPSSAMIFRGLLICTPVKSAKWTNELPHRLSRAAPWQAVRTCLNTKLLHYNAIVLVSAVSRYLSFNCSIKQSVLRLKV